MRCDGQTTTKIICTHFCTPLTILARNPPKSAQIRQSPKLLAAQALSPNSRISPDAHKRPETAFARLGVKGSWVRIPPARQNGNLGFVPGFLFCLVLVASGFAEADRRRRSTVPASPTKCFASIGGVAGSVCLTQSLARCSKVARPQTCPGVLGALSASSASKLDTEPRGSNHRRSERVPDRRRSARTRRISSRQR